MGSRRSELTKSFFSSKLEEPELKLFRNLLTTNKKLTFPKEKKPVNMKLTD